MINDLLSRLIFSGRTTEQAKQELSSSYITDLGVHPLVATYIDPTKCFGLPPWDRDQMLLHIGLNTPIRIPDLTVDDTGIQGTLSFNHKPHYVSIPWRAVIWFGEPGKEPRAKTPAAPDRVKTEGNVVKVDFKTRKAIRT